MALQFSVLLRDTMLAALGSTIGGAGSLAVYSGSPPANCAASPTGTLLASLPFGTPAAGAVTLNGLVLSGNAGASGTAGYFRLTDGGANCHMQGTCGIVLADLIFDSTTIVSGQSVNIIGFTLTAPAA